MHARTYLLLVTVAFAAAFAVVGCERNRTSIPAVLVNGVIECPEALDKRLVRTNQFRLLIADQHLLLQFDDAQNDAEVLGIIDGSDLGRWWKAEEADAQDSGWIQARNSPLGDGLPVQFREQLAIFPMLWAGGAVAGSLGTTLSVLPRTNYFTLLDAEDQPAGIHVRDEAEAGRIKRRHIHTYFSVGETNADSVVPLFTVEYAGWRPFEASEVPAAVRILDLRLGRIAPPTRYNIRFESLVRTNVPVQQAYPDIRASNCMLSDRRTGKLTSGSNQIWPARHTTAYARATRSTWGVRIIALTLITIFPGVLLLLMKRKNKSIMP